MVSKNELFQSKSHSISENQGNCKILSEEEFIKALFYTSPEKGFDLLFRKYYNKLCSHSVRYVHSKTIAEDIVSDVFINFWQNKSYEIIESSFKAYLYRSVQFRSFNALKKDFLNITEDSNIDFKIPIYDHPDEILFYQDLTIALDTIISNLPSQCRKAFQLSRLDGLKYHEIARELNISTSAVEKLISRAISKIRLELIY